VPPWEFLTSASGDELEGSAEQRALRLDGTSQTGHQSELAVGARPERAAEQTDEGEVVRLDGEAQKGERTIG
jgi:hypothetical protein